MEQHQAAALGTCCDSLAPLHIHKMGKEKGISSVHPGWYLVWLIIEIHFLWTPRASQHDCRSGPLLRFDASVLRVGAAGVVLSCHYQGPKWLLEGKKKLILREKYLWAHTCNTQILQSSSEFPLWSVLSKAFVVKAFNLRAKVWNRNIKDKMWTVSPCTGVHSIVSTSKNDGNDRFCFRTSLSFCFLFPLSFILLSFFLL